MKELNLKEMEQVSGAGWLKKLKKAFIVVTVAGAAAPLLP